MLTILSGTSRTDSMTRRVAALYHALFEARGISATLLSLEGLAVWERGPDLLKLEADILIPTKQFVFIMPEYNGSFPGILKTLLDNSDIKQCWWGKRALLTGVSDGRAGNLRGMDHMTGILQYLHMHVYWDKLPISRINEEMDNTGQLLKPATRAAIEAQVDGFMS